jgi:hypothetical protein
MDVCRQGDSRFARSALFENALNKRESKDVMNVPISPVPSLTNFQCRWARRLFYERSRIGEPTERDSGSWLKKSDIDVLNVDKGCLEERDSVSTANRQSMWIDLGGVLLYRANRQQTAESVAEEIRACGGSAATYEVDLLDTFDPAQVTSEGFGIHRISQRDVDVSRIGVWSNERINRTRFARRLSAGR